MKAVPKRMKHVEAIVLSMTPAGGEKESVADQLGRAGRGSRRAAAGRSAM